MDLLIFCIAVLIVVGIVAAIAYYIPFPPPLFWLKWALPCIALVVALIVILHRMGLAS